MAFAPAADHPRARLRKVRYSVVRAGQRGQMGRVVIPPDLLGQLGWTHHTPLEVLVGSGDDHGWFGLRPSLQRRQRGHLKVARSGVGTFVSRTLVTQGPKEPDARADGETLYLKLL